MISTYTIEITVTRTNPDEPHKHGLGIPFYEKVQGENLLQALSQFQLALGRLTKQEIDNIERHSHSYICSKCNGGEDDIPF